MWPAVMRFAQTVLMADGPLEDVVDINDNGLPVTLRLHTTPNMVPCMATPLRISLLLYRGS